MEEWKGGGAYLDLMGEHSVPMYVLSGAVYWSRSRPPRVFWRFKRRSCLLHAVPENSPEKFTWNWVTPTTNYCQLLARAGRFRLSSHKTRENPIGMWILQWARLTDRWSCQIQRFKLPAHATPTSFYDNSPAPAKTALTSEKFEYQPITAPEVSIVGLLLARKISSENFANFWLNMRLSCWYLCMSQLKHHVRIGMYF